MAVRNDTAETRGFTENRDDLLALARAILRDDAAAEDIVQEGWIRWSGRRYPIAATRQMLRRIVKNLAIDQLRRRRREGDILRDLAFDGEAAPDTERVVSARADLETVAAALAEMPERTRLAFRLSALDGLTYAEIAARLEISRPRAHQLVRSALVKITLRLGR